MIINPLKNTATQQLMYSCENYQQGREHKKHLLQIAREHEKARELERVQRYRMPQDMKKGEKEDYYEVDEREKQPNSGQKKWESEQLASAMYKFGAKDASQRQQEEYELLLEDQIEFIQAMTMDDRKKDKKSEPAVSEQEKKRMNLKETKESLPVYPFRNDLIAAIREHQILLIASLLGCAVGNGAMAAYLYLHTYGVDVSMNGFVPVVSLSCVIFFSAIGIFPLALICVVESLPSKVRTLGLTVCSFNLHLISFFTTKLFPVLSESIHMYGCISIFAVACAFGVVFVTLFLNETKGKNLDTK